MLEWQSGSRSGSTEPALEEYSELALEEWHWLGTGGLCGAATPARRLVATLPATDKVQPSATTDEVQPSAATDDVRRSVATDEVRRLAVTDEVCRA